jgi:hypothetical protein
VVLVEAHITIAVMVLLEQFCKVLLVATSFLTVQTLAVVVVEVLQQSVAMAHQVTVVLVELEFLQALQVLVLIVLVAAAAVISSAQVEQQQVVAVQVAVMVLQERTAQQILAAVVAVAVETPTVVTLVAV